MKLQTEIHDVFVVGSARERAQIEQFTYTHESITHAHLGTLCGFWGVKESTPWNDYIAHRLSAHARTTYFARHRKSAQANFAHTLSEINTLLADHAIENTTTWAGMLDGAICAYTDDHIFFSVTGDAMIFLMRDGVLREISHGAAPDTETQEIDITFTDVISGDIRPGDKLLITSRELLSLVPHDELTKNARTMDNTSFVQFITTVLTNECSLAATHIIDITEDFPATEGVTTDTTPRTEPANAFSAQSYKRPSQYTGADSDDIAPNTPDGDYTDKRTGHIYVQGDTETSDRSLISPLAEYTDDLTNTLTESAGAFTRKARANSKELLAGTPHLFTRLRSTTHTFFEGVQTVYALIIRTLHRDPNSDDVATTEPAFTVEENPLAHIDPPAKKHKKARILQVVSAPKKMGATPKPTPARVTPVDLAKPSLVPSESATSRTETTLSLDKDTAKSTLLQGVVSASSSLVLFCGTTFRNIFQACRTSLKHMATKRISLKNKKLQKKETRTNKKEVPQKPTPISKSRLTHLTTPFLAGIFIVLVVYMLWWTMRSKTGSPDVALQEPTIQEESPSESAPKTIANTDDATHTTLSDPIILKDTGGNEIVRARGTTYIVGTDDITTLTGSRARTHTLPTGIGAIAHSIYMPATHTFFFVTTTNALYAFDPRGGTFTKQAIAQTISFDDISTLATRDTDLLIAGRDMITTHARQSNGFAAGTDLLTQKRILIDTNTILVQDDNLYILNKDGLLYVDEGNVIAIDTLQNIHARTGHIDSTDNLLILDAGNASLLHVERDTFRILHTYTHPLLAGATAITRDGDKLYVTTQENTLSFVVDLQ